LDRSEIAAGREALEGGGGAWGTRGFNSPETGSQLHNSAAVGVVESSQRTIANKREGEEGKGGEGRESVSARGGTQMRGKVRIENEEKEKG
jgi:hypothetical protein